MRWKLNSVGYGPRVLAWIGLFTIAVPLIFHLCVGLLGLFGIDSTALFSARNCSLAAGLVLLVLFVLLLTIEYFQDRLMDVQYRKTRHHKIKLLDGYYECQYCGSRKVRSTDKQCRICGRKLL